MVMYILLQFGQDLCNVTLVRQSNQDLKFLQFHVDWVIVLDKEHLHLMLENIRSTRDEQNTSKFVTHKNVHENLKTALLSLAAHVF